MARPAQHLENIALTWAAADWLGTSTENLIVHRYGISGRHARRLIAQAREVGLIPCRPPKIGPRTRKKNNG